MRKVFFAAIICTVAALRRVLPPVKSLSPNYAVSYPRSEAAAMLDGSSATMDRATMNDVILSLLQAHSMNLENEVSLREILSSNKSILDHVHILTIIHRCAKHGLQLEGLIDWETAMEVLRSSTRNFNSQSISNALYGMKSIVGSQDQSKMRAEMANDFAKLISNAIESADVLSFSGQAVGNSLYGLHGLRSHSTEVKQLLRSLKRLIYDVSVSSSSDGAAVSIWTPLSGQEFSNALWGLQYMSDGDAEVRDILDALAKRSSVVSSPSALASPSSSAKRLQKKYFFSAQQLGMAMNGLRGKSSASSEVRGVLLAILRRISPDLYLDAQSVGNVLGGLSGMSSEHEEVRMFLLELSKHFVDASKDAPMKTSISVVKSPSAMKKLLSEQDLSNALYGLQGLSSDHKEVRTLIDALTQRINQELNGLSQLQSRHSGATTALSLLASSQSIGNSLLGLRAMRSDRQEVRSLLKTVTRLISAGKRSSTGATPLSGASAAMALNGLQGMDSRTAEVRSLLAEISPLICASKEVLHSHAGIRREAVSNELRGKEVGMALSGLREMNINVPEVMTLVSALVSRIERFDSSVATNMMTGADCSSALSGLRNVDLSKRSHEASSGTAAIVEELLNAVVTRLDPDAVFTVRDVCAGLHGFQGFSAAESPSMQHLLRIFASQLSTVVGDRSGSVEESNSLTSQGFGMAMTGLSRSMAAGVPEAYEALDALISLFEKSAAAEESKTVHTSHAAHGQLLSVSSAHTVQPGRAKGFVVRRFDAAAVAMSLHALKGVAHDDHPAIERLLQELASYWPISVSSSASWFGHDVRGDASNASKFVGMSLYGLNRMLAKPYHERRSLSQSTSTVELSPGLSAVLRKIHETLVTLGPHTHSAVDGGVLEPQAVAMALFGLRQMPSSAPEVRQILAALAPLIRSCRGPFTGDEVAMCISSLRHMPCDQEEVKDVLSALAAVVGPTVEKDHRIVAGHANSHLSADTLDTNSMHHIHEGEPSHQTAIDIDSIPSACTTSHSHTVSDSRHSTAVSRIQKTPPLSEKNARVALDTLKRLDSTVDEVRELLVSFSRRIHAQRQWETLQRAATSAMPLMLGFFLIQEQLGSVVPSPFAPFLAL